MLQKIFDYHYGMEAEQYTFYRIPKVLMCDPRFARLSIEAKLLYGLMMDRLDLSAKNGWRDENGRVYIYFTIEDICEKLGCGKDKALKMLKELEQEVGLIERKKQGQGRPTRIYVKNFTRIMESSENQDSIGRKIRSLEYGNAAIQTAENQDFGLRENSIQEYGKPEGNNTEYKKTDTNHTELSIYPSERGRIDEIDGYREKVKERISYTHLMQLHPYNSDISEIVELIVEVLCTQGEYVKIGKKQVYTSLVKERLNQLDYTHIEYILECMKASAPNIRNIKAYLLESLFNAPVTIGNYYSAKVNYDFCREV